MFSRNRMEKRPTFVVIIISSSVKIFPLANINSSSPFDFGFDIVRMPMLFTKPFPRPYTIYSFPRNQ